MPLVSLLACLVLLACAATGPDRADAGAAPQVLVFSKTAGFRHDSIPAGVAMLRDLGAAHGFAVVASEDAALFSAATLPGFAAVVWLNTTGDVMDETQQDALRAYIEDGGGWVGIHAAADSEYGWPWYGAQLLGGGAWFLSHTAIQPAELVRERADHPSTAHLPARFAFTDEWYNFRANPRAAVDVLLALDEATFDPGADRMGDHPIAWARAVAAGRAWYTALGHRDETYADAAFRSHVLGGLQWVMRAVPVTPSPPPTPTARWGSPTWCAPSATP
jgi:type 1 glutamine amidotransferase